MSNLEENVAVKKSIKISEADYKGIYEGARGEYHEVIVNGAIAYVPVEGSSYKKGVLEVEDWVAESLGI